MAYNSTDFWACKPLNLYYSTVYRLGEKTGGLGGCPPGNKVPLPKKNHVTNQWILSTTPL